MSYSSFIFLSFTIVVFSEYFFPKDWEGINQRVRGTDHVDLTQRVQGRRRTVNSPHTEEFEGRDGGTRCHYLFSLKDEVTGGSLEGESKKRPNSVFGKGVPNPSQPTHYPAYFTVLLLEWESHPMITNTSLLNQDMSESFNYDRTCVL